MCLFYNCKLRFSFLRRYNVEATDPTNNCLLSTIPYDNLNFYVDIEPDRNYDIYAMAKDASSCVTSKQPDQRPPDGILIFY